MAFKFIKSHRFFLILLFSILAGSFTGYCLGPKALILKSLGDIFLNLLFTVVVPLVFFSIASAIAEMKGLNRLGKIVGSMIMTFLFVGMIASIYMLVVVKMFPPAETATFNLSMPEKVKAVSIGDQITQILTVPDFIKLFSRENMLALMFFSMLLGLATLTLGAQGKSFARFLSAGTAIFMKIVSFIMYYAPIGFFAYFAVLVATLGPQLLTHYFHSVMIYYVFATLYFLVGFSFFAYLAGKTAGIKIFWKNIFLPMTTAFATSSSAASIPANLAAAKEMKVPADIYETVIPIGTILHKQGSILGGMVKIAMLFGIFKLSFSGLPILCLAVIVAMLVGTVMGAIPGGGMIAEMLILSIYGFPPEALVIIGAFAVLIDPLATTLNVTGNTVSSMLVARLVGRQE